MIFDQEKYIRGTRFITDIKIIPIYLFIVKNPIINHVLESSQMCFKRYCKLSAIPLGYRKSQRDHEPAKEERLSGS